MSTADLDEQIERLKKCEYLKEGEVKALCSRAREILNEEANVQLVDSPVTVSIMELLDFDEVWGERAGIAPLMGFEPWVAGPCGRFDSSVGTSLLTSED